ncbi:virB8 family protein [Delftia sp. GW456-R20]|uniref:virB8 family protein n=1 Tax=Delftia sp. GW456-R20 TaxID=1827145 RepID=UPI0009EECD60|nr:type IV secretion system protein [Delftia sp. GW456-R20]
MNFKNIIKKKEDSQAHGSNERGDYSWDSDINLVLRKSERRGWSCFYFAVGVIALQATAIVVLTPLKSVVPYMYTVDKQTGEVSVGATVKDFVNTTELNDKHWVNKFVLSHERYNYRLLQMDYDTVQLLAGDQVYNQYAARFDGPNSLEKRYLDKVQITPKIISLSITGGNLATVRFEKTQQEVRTGGESKTTRWVALIRYEYKSQVLRKENDLVQNPLGFTVTGYQIDPELTTDAPGWQK